MAALQNGIWTIIGQGLAGTCLAWELWRREVPFRLIDRENGGSSRIAAGMINPVTGKNFTASWRIGDFLPEALGFYREIEETLGCRVWHPLPVLRLAGAAKEWRKIESKLTDLTILPWLGGAVDPPTGWQGAVWVTGGGRLDTLGFLDASRGFFQKNGCYAQGLAVPGGARQVWCAGAAGLLAGLHGPHRSAKGEILTLRAPHWDESRIVVGAGGWMVPIGGGNFKCGATYEWQELDEMPTAKAREWIEGIARKLGGDGFEVIGHDAGVRPIMRRSQPLIGPLSGGGWMFNGLGSKGSLYAPGMARRLADWLVLGIEAEAELDVRHFQENPTADGCP